MSETLELAKTEIFKSLNFSSSCLHNIGFSFEKPKNRSEYWKQKAKFIMCVTCLCYHVFGDYVYVGLLFYKSPRFEDIMPVLHVSGYATLCIAKVFVLWYKFDTFRNLLIELAEIWPMPPLDNEYQAIKSKSLNALSLAHRCYSVINLQGIWFYYITPIAVYFHQRYWAQEDASLGFVWSTWYPFDKHKPLLHIVVYIFEMYIGQICVWTMTSTDLLFTGMASHISLLLRLLQGRLKCIGSVRQSDEEHYAEIKRNIKVHQRLIKYCYDLEDAFSLSNLINVLFSSINICCVVFNVLLLDPLLAISNKLFIASALLQIGMICWYADDTFHANFDVAEAVYNSKWYLINSRCRLALILLIQRAQTPIAFTAMNFMNMNLATCTSIITRSYSYFALLYTFYKKN